MTYLDTHTAIFVAAGDRDALGKEARAVLSAGHLRGELLIAPTVVLEIEFLREVNRVGFEARRLVDILELEFGVRVCDLPFTTVAKYALDEKWTRDPFDRLIVAQARARSESVLVTRDAAIRKNYSKAVW